MSLVQLDLNKAKDAAKQENWDHKLPLYDREAEDGSTDVHEDLVINEEKLSHMKLQDDAWKDKEYDLEDSDRTCASSYQLDDETSEQRSDMGSLEDVYVQAGKAEGNIQSGDISERARTLLRSMPADVRKVGDQTSLVDLTFLKSGEDRRRVAEIIERVLMIHTENVGASQMTPSEKRGVFRYQVLGNTSSANSSSSSPIQPPSKVPRLPTPKTPRKPTLERLPELDNGVILSPKFPGLPRCVVRYGRYGLTPEMVSKVRTDHPDKTLNQVILMCLRKTKEGRKVPTLYNLTN